MTINNFRIRLSHIGIVLLASSLLGSCSKSDPKPEKKRPLTKAVEYPYIADSTLYEFDPETGVSEVLAESNKSLMIALDTDQTKAASADDDTSYLAQSSLPEYVAYVIDQTLWLFDLSTRKNHSLFTFPGIKGVDQVLYDTPSYICDIEKVITIDANSFKDDKVLHKDEKSVYVKTSETESCDGAPSDYQYYQVLIRDSLTETFTIRRQELKPHRHASDHEHDEDHTHADSHEDDEGNKHEHEHDHEIGDNHEHGHIHGDNHEAEHRLAKNLEDVTEQLPVLVGKLRIASEALMYAGSPIVDIDNEQFGYLGFGWDPSRAQFIYTFYLADTSNLGKDDIDRTRLWELTSSDFSSTPQQTTVYLTDPLFPLLNKRQSHVRLSDSLLIEHNWKIIRLNYAHFFDDDLSQKREDSVNNPVFLRTPDTSAEAVYTTAELQLNIGNTDNALFVVRDQNNLYSVNNNGVAKLIRTMNDARLLGFNFRLLKNHVIAGKLYSDGRSITAINILNGSEKTLLAKTSNDMRWFQLNGNLYINEEMSDGNWRSEVIAYDASIDNYTPDSLTDALWNASFAGVTSIQIAGFPYQYFPAIISDSISLDDTDHYVFSFPFEVDQSGGAFFFNNHYAYIKIKQSREDPTQWYYFDPSEDVFDPVFMFEEASD